MNNKKDKHLTIRLSNSLYEHYVEKAIKKSQKEHRIVKVSEVLREVLEKNK